MQAGNSKMSDGSFMRNLVVVLHIYGLGQIGAGSMLCEKDSFLLWFQWRNKGGGEAVCPGRQFWISLM